MKKIVFVLLLGSLRLAEGKLDAQQSLELGKRIEETVGSQLDSNPAFLKDLLQFDLEVIALKADILSSGIAHKQLALKDLESYVANILEPEVERLSKSKIWPKKTQTQSQKDAVARIEAAFKNVKRALKIVVKEARMGSRRGSLGSLSKLGSEARRLFKMIDSLTKLFKDVRRQPVDVITRAGGGKIYDRNNDDDGDVDAGDGGRNGDDVDGGAPRIEELPE